MVNSARVPTQRRLVKPVLAAVVAALGLFLVIRGVGQFSPGKLERLAAPEPTEPRPSPQAPHARFTPSPERSLRLGEAAPETLIATIEGTVRSAASDSRIPADAAENIAASTAHYLAAIASGSSAQYWEYAARRGGVHSMDLAVPENAARDRSFFESVSQPYRTQSVYPEEILVRPRILRGQNVPQDDFGASTAALVAPGRYPALAQVAHQTDYGHVITADTYEVLIPIGYEFRGAPTTVLLGLWFTRAPGSGEWLQSKIVMYSPRSYDGAIVGPPL